MQSASLLFRSWKPSPWQRKVGYCSAIGAACYFKAMSECNLSSAFKFVTDSLCAVNRKYAKGSVLDSSQELFSIGFMNMFTSLFQGYPVAGTRSERAVLAIDY